MTKSGPRKHYLLILPFPNFESTVHMHVKEGKDGRIVMGEGDNEEGKERKYGKPGEKG